MKRQPANAAPANSPAISRPRARPFPLFANGVRGEGQGRGASQACQSLSPQWTSRPPAGAAPKSPASAICGFATNSCYGLHHPDIIAQLETKGHPGIKPQNLSYWFQTGHKQWVAELERLELLRLQSDSLLSTVRELSAREGTTFHDFNRILTEAIFTQTLQDFDPQRLRELLAEKPDYFFQLAARIDARSRQNLLTQEHDLRRQKYQDRLAPDEKPTPNATGGITPEALAQIEAAIKIL